MKKEGKIAIGLNHNKENDSKNFPRRSQLDIFFPDLLASYFLSIHSPRAKFSIIFRKRQKLMSSNDRPLNSRRQIQEQTHLGFLNKSYITSDQLLPNSGKYTGDFPDSSETCMFCGLLPVGGYDILKQCDYNPSILHFFH
jgi:hypothetical protein